MLIHSRRTPLHTGQPWKDSGTLGSPTPRALAGPREDKRAGTCSITAAFKKTLSADSRACTRYIDGLSEYRKHPRDQTEKVVVYEVHDIKIFVELNRFN